MNTAQLRELDRRCRAIMTTHLKTKGYPTLTTRQILNEVPGMWKALDREGVTTELRQLGFTYTNFAKVAMRKAQEQSLFDALREASSRRRK